MNWIFENYYDWLMHKRLRRCYRLLCYIIRKAYRQEGYKEFFQEIESAYREKSEFLAR